MKYPAIHSARERRVGYCAIEHVEPRRMFHITVINPISDVQVAQDSPTTQIDLSGRYDNVDIAGTVARVDTTLGSIYMELFNGQKPETTAKFLSYLQGNSYNGTVFHSNGRLDANPSAARQFLATGGYTLPDLLHIPTTGSVSNEYSLNGVIHNTRGTVALADANSSDFVFNLSSDSAYVASRDNSQQTVFGEIINNSIGVADLIAQTPVYAFPSPFNQLPLANYTTFPAPLPADSSYIKILGGSVVPELSTTVSSDNESLVTASLSGNTLSLNYVTGQTGIANITVSLTSLDGDTVADTFKVAVGVPTDNFTSVNLGVGGSRLIKYNVGNETVVLGLTKGSAIVKFSGTIDFQSNPKNINTIIGTDLVPEEIIITGNQGKGIFSITSKAQVNITNISSDAGIASITGKNAHVNGEIHVIGNVSNILLASSASTTATGTIGSIRLRETSGSISAANIKTITAPQIDGRIHAATTIKSVNVPTINGDVSAGGLVSLAQFSTVTGSLDFGSVGTLSSASVGGAIEISGTAASVKVGTVGGDVSIGGVKTLRITQADQLDITLGGDPAKLASAVRIDSAVDVNLNSTVPFSRLTNKIWTSTNSDAEQISAPRITLLNASGAFSPDIHVVGKISTLVFGSDMPGNITAGSIGTMSVRGNLSGDVTLSDAFAAKRLDLVSLTVKGAIIGNTIRSAGTIGSISAAGILNSSIFAGTDATALPSSTAELASAAAIRTVTVKKATSGQAIFSNSLIAASTVGTINLGGILTVNSAITFGVAADTITRFTAQLNGVTTKKSKLTAPGDSFVQDDFVLRVL